MVRDFLSIFPDGMKHRGANTLGHLVSGRLSPRLCCSDKEAQSLVTSERLEWPIAVMDGESFTGNSTFSDGVCDVFCFPQALES